MNSKDRIEDRLEELGQTIESSESFVDNVMSRVNTRSFGEAKIRLSAWRIIMNSKITKLAAAAVILIAIGVSFTVMEKTTTPAYAIEQTIEAYNTLRYIHINYFDPSHDEPREIWVEYRKDGKVKNVRAHMPQWASPGEGPHVVVWKNNKMQIWFEKSNSLRTMEDKTFIDRFNMLATEADPLLAVERFYKLHEQKQVEIEISEPSNKSEPIRVAATYLPGSPRAGWRWVLFVDQATKLVVFVEIYRENNGIYEYKGLLEYYDYNQPIDDKMFVIENDKMLDIENEDTEFARKLPARIEQFDIDTADLETVKEIFGQPSRYFWPQKTFTEDNLPERYILVYPCGFSVYMHDDRIVEIRHERNSKYVFLDKLRSGSSLDEVFEVIGYPVNTVIGEKNKFEDGVLYKNIDGRNGHCYYARSDHNVRLWFFKNKLTAIFMTRSDYYTPKILPKGIFGIKFNEKLWPVVDVFPEMPAAKAGMQDGDKILKIDNKDISQIKKFSDALKVFNDAGEKVKLTIQRGDQVLDFQIQRSKT